MWGNVRSSIDWLEEQWFQIIDAFGAVVLGIGGRFASTSTVIEFLLYGVGIFLVGFGKLKQSAWQKTFRETKLHLEEGLQEKDKQLHRYDDIFSQLDYNEVFNMELAVLFNYTLKLGYSERISLYRYDNVGFIRIGRYSRNQNLCHGSKAAYPSDQGCIGEAWSNGSFYINNLSDPGSNWDAYVEHQQKYGLSSEDISDLRMKSRCYFGYNIMDFEGVKPVAIIMFESTDPDAFEPRDISNLMENGQSKKLAYLMKAMEPLAPGRLIAHEEGF